MKQCPKCYSEVDDESYTCPKCGFALAKIERQQPTEQSIRERIQNAPPPKKKKGKKSDMIFLLGFMAVIVVILVLVTMPAPTPVMPAPLKVTSPKVSAPPVNASSKKGGTGSTAEEGGTAEEGAAPVANGVYKLDLDGDIYYAIKKTKLQRFLADRQEQLISNGSIKTLENGTQVMLINESGGIAFIDILTGEYEGEVGYVELRALKPEGE